VNDSLQVFLLDVSALFSIVNPIGSALIFSQITAARSPAERRELARKIGMYSALVMLGALWGGAYVLSFFGISLSALRIAGGLVVAASAWNLLQAPERQEERKRVQASEAEGIDSVAFFPLTMPFTAGPGTISVAIALGSNLPRGKPGFALVAISVSAAAVAVALSVWIAYASADRLLAMIGQSRARVLARLTDFLLLCVGTQIALNGIRDFVHGL
jgi:multiple antibiotic resistance protein